MRKRDDDGGSSTVSCAVEIESMCVREGVCAQSNVDESFDDQSPCPPLLESQPGEGSPGLQHVGGFDDESRDV